MAQEVSFPKQKIKIVLAEKIHEAAADYLSEAGFNVNFVPRALEGKELDDTIADAHVIGVRSRTKLRRAQLEHARRLLAVGCFSVGTDQVELDAATSLGVPVFNAPYSSTRSVAELTIGNIIMLARRAGDKNTKLHLGEWDKSLANAEEVRGKTLGIVGYGHIGQQVSILAEAFGMEVVFCDVLKKLPLGRAKPVASLDELLALSDFVTLHVPGTAETKNLIGAPQLKKMRKGRYLLNLSRGNVVDVAALVESLKNGDIGGAALDVFPDEPVPPIAPFATELAKCENVILTPHVGGNTEEAQHKIALEVANALEEFVNSGKTEGSVNFPSVNLRPFPNSHRILNIHRNVPGALVEITKMVSEVGANIDAQHLSTFKDIGYLVMDINRDLSEEVKTKIAGLPISIKTRILY
ncbi:MAG: phosphoglycerate dehydrogenase [Deltaproteobacteria bacterium]|nr:phosphoglycerate dehydrogenase [Deltaproteobacteria bacterium]